MSIQPMWEDPPPSPRRTGSEVYAKWAELAKSRPGQWLRLPKTANTGTVSLIKSGKIKAFSTGKWDATVRALDPNNADEKTLYIKYIGEETA